MRQGSLFSRLDRYILTKYFKTFLLALALIIVIVITFDVSEKLDRFLGHHASFGQVVFDYYFNFIPGFVNLYSPLFIFISVLFFTSKMAGNTEIIAILGSGISYRRMLRPYLYGSVVVAVAVLLLGNFVIPISNRHLIDFEEQYVKSRGTSFYTNVHFQSQPGVQVYAESYDVTILHAFKFCREEIDDEGRLIKRETSDLIAYDTNNGLWKSIGYVQRTVAKDGREKLTFVQDTLVDYGITTTDLDLKSKRIETMNTPALIRHIEREKMRGTGIVKEAQIELYQRLLNPIAIIVMTFIGVSIASRKSRGGIGMHLAIGITLAFGFIVFMKITTVFATGGNLTPFMAVLLPQLVFGIAAVYLIYKAPK
ncbi:MAG: LptF/LptG family permease [Bacteroidales bacterium]|nr:LptF/LptG family permease [Bacteroidales bacterium]